MKKVLVGLFPLMKSIHKQNRNETVPGDVVHLGFAARHVVVVRIRIVDVVGVCAALSDRYDFIITAFRYSYTIRQVVAKQSIVCL